LKRAQIVEFEFARISGFAEKPGRHDDTAGWRDSLKTNRNIHPTSVHIIEVEDHWLPVNADPKGDAPFGGPRRLLHHHKLLELRSTSNCIERALEDGYETIAGILHDFASVRDDGWIAQIHAQGAITHMRFELGNLHQARVADDIRREHGTESPLELRSFKVSARIHRRYPPSNQGQWAEV